MSRNKQNLIWLDLEMTGLDPQNDFIIEIATIVTDKELNTLAEGPVLAVRQSKEVMDAMDAWNQKHHGQSGLIERVLNSPFNEQQVEQQTIESKCI
jgi:oligoribonuclease